MDNFDENIYPSFQRFDHGTVSKHWIHAYAVRDHVYLSKFADNAVTNEMSIKTLLVSATDVAQLENDSIILMSRYNHACTYACSVINPQTRKKLGAKNLGFCIKLFNYVVFSRKQLSTPALAISWFIQSFCLHYTQLATLLSIKFYLGMDSSSDTVLAKKFLIVLKSFAIQSVQPPSLFIM